MTRLSTQAGSAGGADDSVAPGSEQLLELALAMQSAGCSLIPTGQDKKPVGSWKRYQTERADRVLLKKWNADPKTAGFAVVCGMVSGGLEILDFDDPQMYEEFMGALPEWTQTVNFPVQQTGGGGYQLAYRRSTPGGNTKLAWCEPTVSEDGEIKRREIGIETRGEGGYAVIPHSVHPSGNRYRPKLGNWADIPLITDEQADELLTLARALDQTPEPLLAPEPQKPVKAPAAAPVGSEADVQRKYATVALEKELDTLRVTREGGRNDQLNKAAFSVGQLVGAGVLDEVEARQALAAAAHEAGMHEGKDGITSTINSGMRDGKAKPRDLSQVGQRAEQPKRRDRAGKALDLAREKVGKAPAERGAARYTMPTLPRGTDEGTDEANALVLAANGAADRLRYRFGDGWYVYDQQRGVWVEDDAKLTLARRVAGPILRAVVGSYAAELLSRNARDEELEPVLAWRRSVGNNWALNNALGAAAGMEEFVTEPDAWNARPELLNCRNGTLELTSGTLRPHDPADLLTWQAGAAFDPAARHEYVDQLAELLQRDGRHDFLQRLTGSTLYGEAPNEVAVILEGEGGTGKGTLVSAVTAMLGDYATTVDVGLLLANAHGESATGPKPELMKLQGKRLAIAGEPPKGARFNAGRVKGMTGNDPITARQMNSKIMVTFKPVFKLWIHTNYPINTAHDDTGMQRRLRVVPFNARPDRPYAAFKSTLENDPTARAALLNWAYEGFRLWHSQGFDLGMSAEIEAATGAYWKDQNPYERFAAERLTFGPDFTMSSARLKALFEEWAEENGTKMGRGVKMAELYAFIQKPEYGAESGRTKEGRFWYGVAELVTPVTPMTAQPLVGRTPPLRKAITGGQGVTSVTGVTGDDVSSGGRWEGEEL